MRKTPSAHVRGLGSHLRRLLALSTGLVLIAGLLAALSPAATAQEEQADLNEWTQEGPSVNGDWDVSEDGTSVTQNINRDPTFFVSPEDLGESSFSGTFETTDSDDDWMGFVFGYTAPLTVDGVNPCDESATCELDFLLFDWKQDDQCSGPVSPEGYALTRVTGQWDIDGISECHEQWGGHESADGFDVLDTRHGEGEGWEQGHTYQFTLTYSSDRLRIEIEDLTAETPSEEIFDLTASDAGFEEFPDGRVGFYNFSQEDVTYSGFLIRELPEVTLTSDTYSTSEGSESVTLGLERTNPGENSDAFSVELRTQDGTATAGEDYEAVATTVEFAEGQNEQSVAVPIIDDDESEDSEDFSVHLSDADGATIGSPSSATVTIAASPESQPPVANDDEVFATEDRPVRVDVLANDENPDGSDDDLVVRTILEDPSDGTAEVSSDQMTVVYEPDDGFVGEDTFEYQIRNEEFHTHSAEVFVTVEPAGDVGHSCPEGEVPSSDFEDVSSDSPHLLTIDCMAWADLVRGTTSSTFSPEDDVRRDQVASLAARLLRAVGADVPDDAPDAFSDRCPDAHESNVNAMAALGIVEGHDDGTYGCEGPMLRGDLAAVLVSLYEHASGETLEVWDDYFADDDGHPREEAINKAFGAGFTVGKEDGTYGPDDTLRRDQTASFFARVLNHLVRGGHATAG